jgi:hypothetical protein
MKGDKNLRDKLNEQRFPFDEAAWRGFEQMRDDGKEKKDRKLIILFFVIGALSLGLIASLLFGYFQRLEMRDSIEAQKLQLAHLGEIQKEAFNELETELARLEELEKELSGREEKLQVTSQISSLEPQISKSSPELNPNAIRSRNKAKVKEQILGTDKKLAVIPTVNATSKDQAASFTPGESYLEESYVQAISPMESIVRYDIQPMMTIDQRLPLLGSLEVTELPLELSLPIIDVKNSEKSKTWALGSELLYGWHNDEFQNDIGYRFSAERQISDKWKAGLSYHRYSGTLSNQDNRFNSVDADDASVPDMEADTTGLSNPTNNSGPEVFDFDPAKSSYSLNDIRLDVSYGLLGGSKLNLGIGPHFVWRQYSKNYSLLPGASQNAISTSERRTGSSLGVGMDLSLAYNISRGVSLSGRLGVSKYFNGQTTVYSGLGLGLKF